MTKMKVGEMQTLVALGKTIRKLRRAEEMSEDTLAKKINCSRPTVQQLERGTITNVNIIIQACREFNIPTIKIED